jgi:hypothetical protein
VRLDEQQSLAGQPRKRLPQRVAPHAEFASHVDLHEALPGDISAYPDAFAQAGHRALLPVSPLAAATVRPEPIPSATIDFDKVKQTAQLPPTGEGRNFSTDFQSVKNQISPEEGQARVDLAVGIGLAPCRVLGADAQCRLSARRARRLGTRPQHTGSHSRHQPATALRLRRCQLRCIQMTMPTIAARTATATGTTAPRDSTASVARAPRCFTSVEFPTLRAEGSFASWLLGCSRRA